MPAACGTPTVGTAVGLVDELAPQAACRVPVGDPTALANGILALLCDAQQREQMRAQREAARAEREAELARKTIDLASARAARTEQ